MKIKYEIHETGMPLPGHCPVPPGSVLLRAIGPRNEIGAMECWQYVPLVFWQNEPRYRRRIKKQLRRQIDFAIRTEIFHKEIVREHDHPSHRCVWKAIENMTARMNGNEEPWKSTK